MNLFELEQPGLVYTVVAVDACPFVVHTGHEHGARTVRRLKWVTFAMLSAVEL